MNTYEELYHFGIKGMKWGVRRYQNADGTLTEAGKAKYKKKFDKTEVAKQLGKQHDDIIQQAAIIINTFAGMPYSALENSNLYELIDEDRGLGKKYNEEYTKYVNSVLKKKGGMPVKDVNFSVEKAFNYGRFKGNEITDYNDFPDGMTTREYLNSLKNKRS